MDFLELQGKQLELKMKNYSDQSELLPLASSPRACLDFQGADWFYVLESDLWLSVSEVSRAGLWVVPDPPFQIPLPRSRSSRVEKASELAAESLEDTSISVERGSQLTTVFLDWDSYLGAVGFVFCFFSTPRQS